MCKASHGAYGVLWLESPHTPVRTADPAHYTSRPCMFFKHYYFETYHAYMFLLHCFFFVKSNKHNKPMFQCHSLLPYLLNHNSSPRGVKIPSHEYISWLYCSWNTLPWTFTHVLQIPWISLLVNSFIRIFTPSCSCQVLLLQVADECIYALTEPHRVCPDVHECLVPRGQVVVVPI